MRKQITSGAWADHSVIPSLNQLARQYRVGRKAVRLAVDALKQEGHLVPIPRRRLKVHTHAGASSPTNGVIALLYPANLAESVDAPDLWAMHRGVMRAAGRHFMPLYVLHSFRAMEGYPPGLDELPIAGMICLGPMWPHAQDIWSRKNVPAVLVDHPPTKNNLHTISVENAAGVRRMVEELVARGHKRIAFMRYVSGNRGTEDADSLERRQAFMKEMRRHGLAVPPEAIVMTVSQTRAHSIEIQRFLAIEPHFTAIICTGEKQAIITLDAARAQGRRVPHDLTVLCFRSSESKNTHQTGASINFEAMGDAAVDLLYTPRTPAQRLRLPPVWHPGKTMGDAPK